MGTTFLHHYAADVYLATTKNIIAQLANPIDNNIIEYQTRNFNNSTSYGFSLSVPFTITKGWTTSNNFFLSHSSYSINEFTIRQTSLYSKTAHTITVKNIVDMDAIVEYRSPYVRANTRFADQFYVDFGCSRKIIKNKARVRLQFSDVFNTAREKERTLYRNTYIQFYQKRQTRNSSLSFTYNFNSGKKFTTKRVEQSNNDEKNRIGN